ncbi:hypothetical protein [Carboxylicivirga taeanensis]|uniref:hypothetical protein n=1 Tax=Carboxylicivirga taeanensis TaxID=1416875 RepID=UPI003F6E10BE
MKTLLPYFMRKIGIIIFIICLIISSISGIDDFITGFTSGYNSTRLDKEISFESVEQDRTLNNDLLFTAEERNVAEFYGFLLALVGICLYILSKEKQEDEFFARLRGQAMIISVVITWSIFLVFQLTHWNTKISALSMFQLQMVIYVVVYAYQKRWKYWM